MNSNESKQMLLDTLKSLQDVDHERGHESADDALLNYINDPEITAAFLALTR